MRRFLCLAVFILMLCSPAFGMVAINEATFPDPSFMNYVKKFDANSDEILSDMELQAVKSMDVNNKGIGIYGLEGIKNFTSLESLNCENNSMIALDLSGMKSLKEVSFAKNQSLATIYISGTSITSIDIKASDNMTRLKNFYATECTSLTTLKIAGSSNLEKLDVKGCANLQVLHCNNSRLEALDLSSCKNSLKELQCSSNGISELDLSGFTSLDTLNCNSNYQLSSLNVNGCTSLKSLYCQYGNLAALDVSSCDKLQNLNCNYNKLVALDIHPDVSKTANYNYVHQNRSRDVVQESDTNGVYYYYNFRKIMPEEKISGIIASSVYAQKEEQNIGSSYKDGIINISEDKIPSIIHYEYKTGHEVFKLAVDLNIYSSQIVNGPRITTETLLASGVKGIAYTARIEVSPNTTRPISWNIIAGVLPEGLSWSYNLDGSVSITGTPTDIGVFEFRFKAHNDGGDDEKDFKITIGSEPVDIPPSIMVSALPSGITNFDYTASLTASGTAPIIWTVDSGSLPDGLFLSSQGIITGMPLKRGTYTFTVKASNDIGYDRRAMTIIITSDTFTGTLPKISTTSLREAIVNMTYNATLYASGTKPLTWSVTRGSLPPGLELLNSGTIIGSATATGTYTFTVQALNAAGRDTKELTLAVKESQIISAPSIITTDLNPGFVGVGYGVTLIASGTRPISWAIINDDEVVPGLQLTDSGILYGIPTTEGTYDITVQAQNTVGVVSKNFSITINPAPLRMKPAITTTELEPGTVDTEYIFQFAASGTPPITWEIIKGKLPKNMELSSNGRLSGLVPKDGKTTFTVRASNAYGSDSRIFTLNRYKYPNITTTLLKDATVARSYSVSLKSSGTKPLTWLLEGSLPTGMVFDASKGTIRGKPSLNGTYNLRVVASNLVGAEIKYLTLRVNAVLPKITPSKLSAGAVGKAYKTTIKTSGTTPITMTYDGYLPEGLSFNENTGMLYGTPSEACTDLPITITASNMGGDTELTYFLTIKGDAPKITTSSLPNGSLSKDYSATLKATGAAPISWSAAGLPKGLELDEFEGTISGAPTEAGTFDVEFLAVNNAKVASKKIKMIITSPPVFEDNSTLDNATAEKLYTHKFKVSGTSTITLNLTGGTLPKGMRLSGKTLKGNPREIGDFAFTITARNSAGSATKNFTLKVNVAPPRITGLLNTGIVGKAYKATLKASGTTPITWSCNGDLPRGITFSNGVFSGIPTEAFDDYISVLATNSGGTDTKTFRLIVRDKTNTTNDKALPEVCEILLQIVEEQAPIVVCELSPVSVDVSGMYDFDVVLSYDVEEGSKLIWIAGSDEPSEDDEIAEFYDDEGAEIEAVPESRNITVSAWLNKDRIYTPKIAIKR